MKDVSHISSFLCLLLSSASDSAHHRHPGYKALYGLALTLPSAHIVLCPLSLASFWCSGMHSLFLPQSLCTGSCSAQNALLPAPMWLLLLLTPLHLPMQSFPGHPIWNSPSPPSHIPFYYSITILNSPLCYLFLFIICSSPSFPV